MRSSPSFRRGIRLAQLVCLVWPALFSCAQDTTDCREAIHAVLADLAAAYSDRDTERVLGFYSEYFSAEAPPLNKDRLRTEIERLMRSSSSIEVEFMPREVICADPVAVAIVSRELKRRPVDEDEIETRSETLQIRFEREHDQWKIDEFMSILPDAAVPAAGAEHAIPQLGFAATIPDGFRYFRAESPFDLELIVGVSQDLRTSVTLGGQDTTMQIEPEQLADIMAGQVGMYFPQCTVTRKQVERIGELPGVVLETECPQYRRQTWARTVVLMEYRTLLIASVSTYDKSGRTAGAALLDRLLASVRRIPRQPRTAETPELAGSTYRDQKHGFEISLPKGWHTRVKEKGALVLSEAPSKAGTIIIFAQDLLETEDPMTLIGKHDEIVSKLTREFSCEGPRTLRVGPLQGAQSWTQFQVGQKVKRWRVYFTDKRTLYAIICDAQPAEKFDELKEEFRATVESIRIGYAPQASEEPKPK